MAEMLSCINDGGIIMAKVLRDAQRLANQVLAYRVFVKMQFSPAQSASSSLAAE